MFVYILTNHTNTVLYTGITNNLTRRLAEHTFNIFDDSFAKRCRLYKLVWFQEFPLSLEAIEAEKKIKGWTRAKKIQLIKQLNPEFKNLFK